MEKLDRSSYDAQIRDIRMCYDTISQNPSLSETRLGNIARARLETLLPGPGPNVPLIKALDDLVR